MRVRWHWKLRRILAALFAAFVCFCPASLAQDGELDPSQPKDITANAIIERFAAKEREWKQLREQYTFRQSVQFQAMDGDQVVGEYRQVADISYVQGKRVKTVVLAPQSSIVLSPEDVDDLETRASFTISNQDFQIVKNKGKSVPDIRIVKKKKVQENLFPQFATWREQIGKYWFPTFSSADDTLPFRTGDVRIKQVLKFTDYKKK